MVTESKFFAQGHLQKIILNLNPKTVYWESSKKDKTNCNRSTEQKNGSSLAICQKG